MHDRISSDPHVMMGKPVIKGTRITVELVLRVLGSGTTIEEMVKDYDVTRDDILAAQTFAAEYMAHDRILVTG